MVFRKNPCDFFRLKTPKNEGDDILYLINLKYGLKPFLQNGVCVSKNRFGHNLCISEKI